MGPVTPTARKAGVGRPNNVKDEEDEAELAGTDAHAASYTPPTLDAYTKFSPLSTPATPTPFKVLGGRVGKVRAAPRKPKEIIHQDLLEQLVDAAGLNEEQAMGLDKCGE